MNRFKNKELIHRPNSESQLGNLCRASPKEKGKDYYNFSQVIIANKSASYLRKKHKKNVHEHSSCSLFLNLHVNFLRMLVNLQKFAWSSNFFAQLFFFSRFQKQIFPFNFHKIFLISKICEKFNFGKPS